MGPIIIFDKSAIQSFSQTEINFLYKYFYINIVPILVNEILADLKKPSNHDSISKEQAIIISKKLYPYSSVVNVNYYDLLLFNILGEKIEMSGRPLVGNVESVIKPNGKKGVIFRESQQEKDIRRWIDGIFTKEEEILAENWRKMIKLIDLDFAKDIFKNVFYNIPKINNYRELVNFVERLFLNVNIQFDLLNILFDVFKIDNNLMQRAISRWNEERHTFFNEFSPYACYCLKVFFVFYFGLSSNLITTKTTNIIDLEYLFYLPFCYVFTSKDNFHINLCPLFLKLNQDFVDANELKRDLKKMSEEWDKLNDTEKENYKSYPIENPDSIVFQLWKKHMKPSTVDKTDEIGEKSRRKILNEVKEIRELKSSTSILSESEIDFMLIEKMMSINSPCPCGSGKKYKDCHGKE